MSIQFIRRLFRLSDILVIKIFQILILLLVIGYSGYLLSGKLHREILIVEKIKQEVIPPPQQFFYLLDSGHGIRFDLSDKCGDKSVPDPKDEHDKCFMEYEFNWAVRGFLASMLDSVGIQFKYVNDVSFYYKDDPVADLKKRVEFINSYIPPIDIPIVVISIHANANTNKNVSGFEVYAPETKVFSNDFYPNKKEFSQKLANEMYNSYHEVFGDSHKYNHNEKALEENFYILKETIPYAILTENEYFTNPDMLPKMKTIEFQRNVALAHFLTIMKLEKK